MIKTTAVMLLAAAATLVTTPRITHAAKGKATMPAHATTAKKSGHVEIKGVNYYYEVHGRGEPLLLLHGGLGSIDMFGPNLGILAEHRLVIAVDLQGHGRTTLGDRPITLIDMGDDMAAILEKLGFEQVDVLGYSMGAGVGFRLADADVQVLRGGRAEPRGLSETARPHGRHDARALQLGRGRQGAEDAGDARLWGQRHVPA